ncbi:MAG: ABC transporter permease subunit [Treponema sp.]|jgi:putative aldouronate transport system permease protein|nr:ABC transporter permease subunit [Treponema sp.]
MRIPQVIAKDMEKNWSLYLLVLPVIVFYTLFAYKPMYGALIAFKDFSPGRGFAESPWIGFEHFARFFTSPYFARLMRNTFLISFYNLVFGFPAPIILALLLNEVRHSLFKRTVQTITYLPHFVSIIVIAGIIADFSMSSGLFNDIVVLFGGTRSPLLQMPGFFRPMYVVSEIWQQVGWGTIIYLSALSGIDAQLYEAAMIDGAGRFKQLIHITLPSIAPTIVILFILRIGTLLNVGYEKTILLYNPGTYETADIISTYVYRVGILEQNWSYSTAIGLFNSLINFALLLVANRMSRKMSETSLW